MNAKKPAKPATKKKTGKLTVKEDAVGVKAGAATAASASATKISSKRVGAVAYNNTISETKDIESCRSCSLACGVK